MNLPLGRVYRLVGASRAGLSCDEDGVALGRIVLVRRAPGTGEVYRYVLRPKDEVGEVLRLAYGDQSNEVVERCYRALVRAAAWLEAGNQALAAAEAVMMGLPQLTVQAFAKLALLDALEKADGASWEDEPRVSAGQREGGRWTSGGGSSPSKISVTSELCAPTRVFPVLSRDDLPIKGQPAPQTPQVLLFERLTREAIEEAPHELPFIGKVPLWLRGIIIHGYFAARVTATLGPGHAEVSYLNGRVVPYGTPGSSRTDGIYGIQAVPGIAVEIKTSNAPMTFGQLRQYGQNLPLGTDLILIRLEAPDE